jgi:hypothetical protein
MTPTPPVWVVTLAGSVFASLGGPDRPKAVRCLGGVSLRSGRSSQSSAVVPCRSRAVGRAEARPLCPAEAGRLAEPKPCPSPGPKPDRYSAVETKISPTTETVRSRSGTYPSRCPRCRSGRFPGPSLPRTAPPWLEPSRTNNVRPTALGSQPRSLFRFRELPNCFASHDCG